MSDHDHHNQLDNGDLEARIARLSLEEKVVLSAGADVWHTNPAPAAGLPALKVSDGPNGARGGSFGGVTSVCTPCGTALGATWDPELVRRIGALLGDEVVRKGGSILLAPTVNLHRHPLAGRNFECYSEDPFLSATMAVAFVSGVQSRDVAATVKHFVANDSEFERMTISSDVDDRTLREVYLRPFEAAVRAGAWAVMTSYNKVNGTYASENAELVTELLKSEWGFDGLVMSDWFGTHSTVPAANAGLDLEMPGPPRWLGARLLDAVRAGEVDEIVIDDKVRRLLRLAARTGQLDEPRPDVEGAVDEPADRALVREVAAAAMVLLRNDGILPLSPDRIGRLAVIGPCAEPTPVQGGGSAGVSPHHVVSVAAALRDRLAGRVDVVVEKGCTIHQATPVLSGAHVRHDGRPGVALSFFDNPELEGAPVQLGRAGSLHRLWLGEFSPLLDPRRFSVRAEGELAASDSGVHRLTLTSAGRARVLLDGQQVLDTWTSQEPGTAFYGAGSTEVGVDLDLAAGEPHALVVEFRAHESGQMSGVTIGFLPPVPSDLMERAEAAAAAADVAVVVVGLTAEWEHEGADRVSMALPGRQDELIDRVVTANPRTVVVVVAGSPTAMPWADRAGAVVQAWYPGQEAGDSVTDVLLGDVEPAGRLPTTFPIAASDSASWADYPGHNGHVGYSEGVFIGHRSFDREGRTPRFCFGYGLGYTRIALGEVTLDRDRMSISARDPLAARTQVSATVTNAGARAGSTVVQVYVRAPGRALPRPDLVLAGFGKVRVEPGETRSCTIELDPYAFAYWDVDTAGWAAEGGRHEVAVGFSSRELPATLPVEVELTP